MSLAASSKYFQSFQPLFDSPYQEGYERLKSVEGWFGAPYGDKCALQVALKAAEVSLGVEEVGTTVHFALTPSVMVEASSGPAATGSRSSRQPVDTYYARSFRQQTSNSLASARDRVLSPVPTFGLPRIRHYSGKAWLVGKYVARLRLLSQETSNWRRLMTGGRLIAKFIYDLEA